jgi:hypothetical protein
VRAKKQRRPREKVSASLLKSKEASSALSIAVAALTAASATLLAFVRTSRGNKSPAEEASQLRRNVLMTEAVEDEVRMWDNTTGSKPATESLAVAASPRKSKDTVSGARAP